MSDHAKFSPSAAASWMNCPGYVEANGAYPDEQSEYAAEGTAAHELAEACLLSGVAADTFIGKEKNGFTVDNEMANSVQVYIDYVNDLAGDKHYEVKVSVEAIATGVYGTADCVVIDFKRKIVYVIDLKYGKGVKVFAEENKQLLTYMLGVMLEFGFLYDLEDFAFTAVIIQPRMGHIDDWATSYSGLLEHGDAISAAIKAASVDNPPRIPGETQCRWCRAAGNCKPLEAYIQDQVRHEFVDETQSLSDEELAEALNGLELINIYVKAIETEAYERASGGYTLPGWKLVEGRSNRKWSNESQAEYALRKMKIKVADIFTKKIISPSQAQKLLGKGFSEIADLVVKPTGKPTLAKATDKRPAIEPINAEAFDDLT